MKKAWGLMVAISILLSVSGQAYGQSLKDLLNSSAVKDAVTSVTGGKKLTVENLAGTWTYTNPAVQLEGDNALKNVAGSVAAGELEKKLKTYCAKVGIVEGMFNYVFNNDSTFTNALKKKTLKGTFSVNPDEKTVELKYALGGKLKVTTLTAHVVISGDELSLLFNADKLLDFLSKISSISDNTTLKMVNKLASEYDGMMLGFELKK
ncbi:DUF4923 family protein [Parabacteroides faecis]|jgi:hypothetical protein|uniref:DUF4923 family protein n=1 Tax=Parabacteroides TaxID=375288 RepID=UPI000EFEADF3|nr:MULTISPECIES: DUF4923 family protein [Parabacteroides]MBC8619516.1 DUF4923 family protein [Parabacteroides faecis]MCS2892017.1 DUF4923 family protein [Parabacteroides faecis]RHR40811.1 DUF4923 family protein [Parabacteroides sp. AF18-52]RHR97635.1 DUF4923 family protein [Parabacteroides sp. AF14-59]UVQ44390.1 DUF4923 family protein [Parabacteroides faecis]